MKKVVIGGFLSLIGTLAILSTFNTAANNILSSWHDPPGRFLSTLSEFGMIPLMVCSTIIAATGLVIMGIEYFKKEEK